MATGLVGLSNVKVVSRGMSLLLLVPQMKCSLRMAKDLGDVDASELGTVSKPVGSDMMSC